MANVYPEPVVGAYVRNAKKEILLVKSHKWGDLWVVAGGHVEYGERIEDALKREVMEELGIRVKFMRLIQVEEGVFPPEFHEKKHFIYLQCECLIEEGEQVKIDNQEIQVYKWFSLTEAFQEKLFPLVRETLHKLQQEETNIV